MDTLPGDKGTPTKTERGHLTPPFGIAGEDVLGLVLRHAQERPEAPALRDDYESFTYKQLEARVKELAAGLHAAGTRPGDRVALNLGNSAAWVTTALACWWLGAIWVPLAAGDPPARAGRMVDDCGAKLIVGGRQGPDLRGACAAKMVAVPDLLAAAGPAPARAFDLGADAYIVYTSGTTGTPKGVRISHRALRCFVGNAALALGFGPATRCLCVSPFHFDGTYSTIFPTLAAGAALVVPKREDLVFIKPFFGMVAEHSITHAAFSPTFLGLLISSRKLATLAGGSLRSVHMGGSQCPAPDVARLWEMLPDVRVFNLYGPAEATVAVSAYEVRREDVAAGRIPFGEPYAGTEFFMVSDEGHLVTGAGELGELYIGGEQLMEGYFGDDELNRKALRRDVVPGKTLYRTGDLVYRDAAGRYFFSGRKTELVAHNGTRVSLTEVALALRTAEGVTAAFCALVDNRGALGIAAFVQAAPGVTAAAVREAARLQLPPAMLPDEIIVVETFPLTLSGKVDREKLLAGAELAPWQAAGPKAAVG